VLVPFNDSKSLRIRLFHLLQIQLELKRNKFTAVAIEIENVIFSPKKRFFKIIPNLFQKILFLLYFLRILISLEKWFSFTQVIVFADKPFFHF